MNNTEKGNNKDGLKKLYGQNRTVFRAKMIAIAVIPLVILGFVIVYLFGPGQIFSNRGIPALPDINIERVGFQEGKIIALIRNTGPIDVTIAQADVNDRIHPAAIEPGHQLPRLALAKVIIPFPWNTGEPYEIGITTSDGTRFSKDVTAAPAPLPTFAEASFFALIGTYVGIVPVLIGLLWLPLLRRLGTNAHRFFLSLTGGLLVFLGVDAIIESNAISNDNVAGVFNGQILIAITIILSLLTLQFISTRLVGRVSSKKLVTSSESTTTIESIDIQSQQQNLVRPVAIALMVSIGIGLHNFGEGLAIGAAVILGEVALGTFLIIGFTLHNTTEGLAIVAPMAKVSTTRKTLIKKLIIMGLIAGAPTIVGAWIGGFLYSPLAAIVFLSIGAGAIFQVVFAIYSSLMGKTDNNNSSNSTTKTKMMTNLLDAPTILGFAAGILIMYITGLFVSS